MGFVVLWLAEVWSKRQFGVKVGLTLGKNSLPIYIVHPLLLYYLKQWYVPATLREILFAILLYGVVCIVVPLFLARLAAKMRLSALLFGRG
jgi:fucose 4-O-acetylase-like acetyltransferase